MIKLQEGKKQMEGETVEKKNDKFRNKWTSHDVRNFADPDSNKQTV